MRYKVGKLITGSERADEENSRKCADPGEAGRDLTERLWATLSGSLGLQGWAEPRQQTQRCGRAAVLA